MRDAVIGLLTIAVGAIVLFTSFGLYFGLDDGFYGEPSGSSRDGIVFHETPPLNDRRVRRRPSNIQHAVQPPEIEDLFTVGDGCALCDQLADATIAFRTPDRMTYGRGVPFELELTPEGSGATVGAALSSGLSGGVQVHQGVPYSMFMEATLSGPSFDVSPEGPQRQTILPDRSTLWAWVVTPSDFGEAQELTVTVAAIIRLGDELLPPVGRTVFRTTIPVDIKLWDRLTVWAAAFTPIHGAMVALLGSLAGVFTWFLRKTKRGQD